MKKTLGTMAAAVMVVLLTASFSFAEYTLGGVGNFPYFQLGCLNPVIDAIKIMVG
ncbi:MAG: hypothetical protein NTY16_05165 [Deltaproteobacteria bacterium]|nr:hypothetical protein [Deltaproteobacteria bacterium]